MCSNIFDLKQTKFTVELLHSSTNGGDGVLLETKLPSPTFLIGKLLEILLVLKPGYCDQPQIVSQPFSVCVFADY